MQGRNLSLGCACRADAVHSELVEIGRSAARTLMDSPLVQGRPEAEVREVLSDPETLKSAIMIVFFERRGTLPALMAEAAEHMCSELRKIVSEG